METETFNMNGTPGFWTFVHIHPFITLFLVAIFILCFFGTVTDVLVAFANRRKGGK